MYPEQLCKPMREDLTSVGFVELKSPEDVSEMLDKKDRTILERNYEQNKEDFQSYAPKVPEQVDFSIKENEITEEMKQNVKENYDTIMKQRQEELNNITFNKQQNVQATEWINKDKDAEEEEEQAEQKKEEAITENRKYEATQ